MLEATTPTLCGSFTMTKELYLSVGWSTNFRNEYEPGSRIGFYLMLNSFSKSFPIFDLLAIIKYNNAWVDIL